MQLCLIPLVCSLLKQCHHAGTKPWHLKIRMERSQGPGPLPQPSFRLTARTTLSAMGTSCLAGDPPAPGRHTPDETVWSRDSCSPESCPNRKLMNKINDCCFKLLHFGVVCYAAIVFRTLLTLQNQKSCHVQSPDSIAVTGVGMNHIPANSGSHKVWQHRQYCLPCTVM